jgi:hypothetical protein
LKKNHYFLIIKPLTELSNKWFKLVVGTQWQYRAFIRRNHWWKCQILNCFRFKK